MLPRLVALLQFAALIGLIAFWTIHLTSDIPSGPAVSFASSTPSAADSSSSHPGAELFGANPIAEGPVRVLGIIALGHGHNSAIISMNQGTSQTVAAGTKLNDHLTVESISSGGITLKRDGISESVPLSPAAGTGNTYLR